MIEQFYDLRPEVLALDRKALSLCREQFAHVEEIRDYNQLKMLRAFTDSGVEARHFWGSSGYGVWDDSRNKLEEVFARCMGAEAALVRPQFMSGTHTLTVALFGLLRTGDTLLAATGRPYDTLEGVIGIGEAGKGCGTLREYGIEPDAETVQTYRTINEELWRQLEKGQIRRDKLMGERFTRFLKAVNAAGNGVEMNKFYLDQLSTHPDLTSPNVLDVLRELSEVATLAVVTNGFDRVQSRRVRESGILDFVEDVFVSEKMDSEKPNRKIFDAALRALGVENREHVLMVGDSLSSDVQGGVNAGLDTCWYNPNHAENPGKVVPTYEISSLEELYPLVMEPEELANVGLKNRRHQL